LADLRASASAGRMDERKLLDFLEQLLVVVTSANGRKACADLKIEPRDFFAGLKAEGLPKLAAFLDKRLPRRLSRPGVGA
jgi:hypothetical protein